MKAHLVLWRLTLALLFAALPALAQEADAGPAPDAGAPALSPEDQKLLEEIEAATGGPAKPRGPPATGGLAEGLPPGPSNAPAAKGSSGAFSNVFNPAISVNGLILGSGFKIPGEPAGGSLELQEVEVQLISNVDPYFSANLILAIPSGESLEIEEGYLAAIPQLAGISFRAGKIKAPFGRENPLHTHGLPFVEKSLIGSAAFGDEGLNQLSVEGSALVPLPWYSLVTVTLMDGREQPLLGSSDVSALAGFAALRNVFDLTDDSTLEAGVSYTAGRGTAGRFADAGGAHLVFKWKPARDATNSSLVATLEGILTRQPAADPMGFYGYLQWQLTRGWYLGGRFEYLTDRLVTSEVTTRQSAILVYAPTEFSAFRLQANAIELPGQTSPTFEGFLQANFTIGLHPAHSY
ncbi:MAG: hypothetical protein ACYC8T_12570 [Myxococcaceae bacterium]